MTRGASLSGGIRGRLNLMNEARTSRRVSPDCHTESTGEFFHPALQLKGNQKDRRHSASEPEYLRGANCCPRSLAPVGLRLSPVQETAYRHSAAVRRLKVDKSYRD